MVQLGLKDTHAAPPLVGVHKQQPCGICSLVAKNPEVTLPLAIQRTRPLRGVDKEHDALTFVHPSLLAY